MSEQRKEALTIAKIALEEEIANMRAERDSSYSDNVKESLNSQILSFVLCIQHLNDLIGDE